MDPITLATFMQKALRNEITSTHMEQLISYITKLQDRLEEKDRNLQNTLHFNYELSIELKNRDQAIQDLRGQLVIKNKLIDGIEKQMRYDPSVPGVNAIELATL